MAALAGEGQQILTCARQGMAAVFAFDAGEAIVQITAIEITVP